VEDPMQEIRREKESLEESAPVVDRAWARDWNHWYFLATGTRYLEAVDGAPGGEEFEEKRAERIRSRTSARDSMYSAVEGPRPTVAGSWEGPKPTAEGRRISMENGNEKRRGTMFSAMEGPQAGRRSTAMMSAMEFDSDEDDALMEFHAQAVKSLDNIWTVPGQRLTAEGLGSALPSPRVKMSTSPDSVGPPGRVLELDVKTKTLLQVNLRGGTKVAWKITIQEHDCYFSASFAVHMGTEVVVESQRLSVADGPVEHTFVAGAAGTLYLLWDNSFSWLRRKQVTVELQPSDLVHEIYYDKAAVVPQ